MSERWYRGFDMPDIDMLKEGQMSGALSGRLAQLFSMANEEEHMARAPISIDPGDMSFLGSDDSPGLALSLPIAYDVWYLWHTVNIIPDDHDKRDEFMEIVLQPLFKGRGEAKPLRTINKEAAGQGITPDLSFFQAKGIPYIKEMRFETFLHDRAPLYDSPGPNWINDPGLDHEGSGPGDIYAGYLAFPVGPLGVMRVVSLISESILAQGGESQDDSERPKPGGELLSPMEHQDNACMGLHLVEDTYLIHNPDTEYPAKEMVGTEEILPHHWLRYWLKKSDKFPVPGEFMVLLAKAQGVPPHCWWYQETNPISYSGNFFETEYYTSGIVLAVIEEVDRDKEAGTATYEVTEVSTEHEQKHGHGEYHLQKGMQFTWEEVGAVYKIRVKDQDLYLKSSDFLLYKIDGRVAVRKVPGIQSKNFTWEQLEPGRGTPGSTVEGMNDFDISLNGKPFEINRKWVIVPITFYEE
ncbi:MAG: hypothetical protein JEZ12_13025 [Desulfobacterium sp.]|nr:hypothetical protein [Desulfobacterium sp.]